jgi:hypothetical protein
VTKSVTTRVQAVGCRAGQAEKYLPGAEQPFDTIVVSQSRGEAPQPLTLNSLGVEPRLPSGWGSFFLGLLRLARFARLLDFRDRYYAKSGLLNHLNSIGFNYRGDRLLHFPYDLLH